MWTIWNAPNGHRAPNALNDFRAVLEQKTNTPTSATSSSSPLFLNNLYGVDIMEEAVEICKLRLFLKLMAQLERGYDQIEPLPDIDFNIRAGQTRWLASPLWMPYKR